MPDTTTPTAEQQLAFVLQHIEQAASANAWGAVAALHGVGVALRVRMLEEGRGRRVDLPRVQLAVRVARAAAFLTDEEVMACADAFLEEPAGADLVTFVRGWLHTHLRL